MIKIGILFGGPSREREISFIGGQTVYENLNQSIFKPIPIFIDSLKNFILLDWNFIFKNTIRDFYPPKDALPNSEHAFHIYIESLNNLSEKDLNLRIKEIGQKIEITELSNYFDIAFLNLHGTFGADGQIQALLNSLEIPYTGSGVKASAIGMDKAFQKKIMKAAGFASPKVNIIDKATWKSKPKRAFFEEAKHTIGFPMVIRPANQGSSIGVSILDEQTEFQDFQNLIDAAFFIKMLPLKAWNIKSDNEKEQFIQAITDIQTGIGFPLLLEKKLIHHPEILWKELDKLAHKNSDKTIKLESLLSEQKVIIESFIHGKEFSCIVIRLENGKIVALPPTEIIKGSEIFDYDTKFRLNHTQQRTPIDLPHDQINQIRLECARLFDYLEFNTYARIDGFITINRTVVLNDPNTTSSMIPSAFMFHQAAAIGLNPSQLLSFIIRNSIQERINELPIVNLKYEKLLKQIDRALKTLKGSSFQKQKVGVIFGGYSLERNVSIETARNIYEKLASSNQYEPVLIYLTGDDLDHQLYLTPFHLLLKGNANEIHNQVTSYSIHPVLKSTQLDCISTTKKYANESVVLEPKRIEYEDLLGLVDQVFIAIHGRPGEDGQIQKRLNYLQIPYNGSDVKSSQVTINKYKTLQILKEYGLTVPHQLLVEKNDYVQFPKETLKKIEKQFNYPFIAKPVDDGCSAAVKLIETQNQLCSFLKAIFRDSNVLSPKLAKQLDLQAKEEFPQKEFALIEDLITDNGANRFLETKTGVLTHIIEQKLVYEIFESSEIRSCDVNSNSNAKIFRKGYHITPAHYSNNEDNHKIIAQKIKAEIKKATQLLGIQGYASFDAFIRIYDNNLVETIIIEVNSLPKMTKNACIFHQAAINNYKPFDFINKILNFGVDVGN